jgi:hypothetical protein
VRVVHPGILALPVLLGVTPDRSLSS